MKGIYLEKNNNIAYFIESYKEDEFVEIDGNIDIAKSAFAHSDAKKILFKGCYKEIGENAFEGCEELTTVIFGELGKDEVIKNANPENREPEKNKASSNKTKKTPTDEVLEKETIKNLTLASASGDYVIQANAFKGCEKLTTLVLPEVEGTLTIEKDAFCGCGVLRTVVVICDKIDVTGNPFANFPEHLTFVCKKDSEVARFARENGYRSVYVD